MINSVTVKTTTRDQIAAIAHQLVEGIDQNFLFRSKKPIVVLVNGTEESGKGIFPSETVQYFREKYQFSNAKGADIISDKGMKDHDEYKAVLPAGSEPFGFYFYNQGQEDSVSELFWDIIEGQHLTESQLTQKFLEAVLDGEHAPNQGICFIHNATRPEEIAHDFRISLISEKPLDPVNLHWDRVVKVSGNSDSELFQSERFQKALSAIQRNNL